MASAGSQAGTPDREPSPAPRPAPEEMERLLKAAHQVALHAWAPYSRFRVGAALLDQEGRLFSGCNVEVASYRLTTCAEQAAVAAAVAAGARRIRALAVVSPDSPECLPCGGCRQTLAEFADPDLPVILERADGTPLLLRLEELLPRTFRLAPPGLRDARSDPEATRPGRGGGSR